MSGRVVATDSSPVKKPSRQIQILLRNQETKAHVDSELQSAGKSLIGHGQLSEIMKEMDQMIGLDHVKELVYEIYALLQIGRFRNEAGLQSVSHVYHMIFKGNPGTGKTTLARIVAKMFHTMGVLSKGHFIEVERADLVGEYIGHTALKTRELIKRSLGGILFVDEAYSLARGGEKDFGKEAIDTLVKAMEDYRNQFVLILAGYSDEMDDFLATNPGLPSRFPLQLDFPDYTVDELVQIFELMMKERDYSYIPQTIVRLKQHLLQEKSKSLQAFSNARYVRNLIEKAIRHQAVRLLSQHTAMPSRQDLMLIRPEDIKSENKSSTMQ